MIDLDAFMADAVTRDTIDLQAKPSDIFSTRGGLEYQGNETAPWRLRSGHVLDFNGATVILDDTRVTDEMLRSESPIQLIGSEQNKLADLTGSDAWSAVTVDQCVKNVKLVANFSKLQPRAKALGVSLRITGVGLQGHRASIENPHCSDFGAYRHNPNAGAEAFPLVICGAFSAFDRHALTTVDPAVGIFEPAQIIGSVFDGYVPELSNDQVTVNMVVGTFGAVNFTREPWSEREPWIQRFRRSALLEYTVLASGKNQVQGGTIYQSLEESVVHGKTQGAAIGCYGDYLSNRKVRIASDCVFKGGEWGVAFRLSPTAGNSHGLAEQFSHEDYVIEKFECDARNGDVYLNVDPMPDGSYPPTRYVRNIAIDERLRVVNDGNRAGVVKIPAPNTSKRGCKFW